MRSGYQVELASNRLSRAGGEPASRPVPGSISAYCCIAFKVSDKLELNRHAPQTVATISKAGWPVAGIPSMRDVYSERHRLAARRSFARCCFCVRPCSDPRVGSAPFPLFSRVILAPVFGCANPGPTTLSNLNHEIKMTHHAVQADDQGCSGRP
jgi:hypothetical protein